MKQCSNQMCYEGPKTRESDCWNGGGCNCWKANFGGTFSVGYAHDTTLEQKTEPKPRWTKQLLVGVTAAKALQGHLAEMLQRDDHVRRREGGNLGR